MQFPSDSDFSKLYYLCFQQKFFRWLFIYLVGFWSGFKSQFLLPYFFFFPLVFVMFTLFEKNYFNFCVCFLSHNYSNETNTFWIIATLLTKMVHRAQNTRIFSFWIDFFLRKIKLSITFHFVFFFFIFISSRDSVFFGWFVYLFVWLLSFLVLCIFV